MEIENKYVRWVWYETDGNFKNIVPILRTYTSQDDVKKLIDLGSKNGLPSVCQQLPETVDSSKVDKPAKITMDRYEFYDTQNLAYHYIFTQDNKWICRAPATFFDMENLY